MAVNHDRPKAKGYLPRATGLLAVAFDHPSHPKTLIHLPVQAPTFISLIISLEKQPEVNGLSPFFSSLNGGWKVCTVVFLERTCPHRRPAIDRAVKCVKPSGSLPALERSDPRTRGADVCPL
jgi:hypothetical protein